MAWAKDRAIVFSRAIVFRSWSRSYLMIPLSCLELKLLDFYFLGDVLSSFKLSRVRRDYACGPESLQLLIIKKAREAIP